MLGSVILCGQEDWHRHIVCDSVRNSTSQLRVCSKQARRRKQGRGRQVSKKPRGITSSALLVSIACDGARGCFPQIALFVDCELTGASLLVCALFTVALHSRQRFSDLLLGAWKRV
jgi:hypothetical protein